MPRTPSNHAEHTLAIAAALRELERRLDLLVQALSHESAPVSAEAARSERDARRLVCEAYATIDYAPDDQANESHVCLGVIGGNAAVIDRAEAVNAAKVELRERCKAISHLRVRVPVKDGKGGRVVKSLPLVRVILRELQRSDLSLLAAYRQIPLLTARVKRVAYTRARTRAVYRKDRAAIASWLQGQDRPGTDDDLSRLKRLPTHETQLALVKEHYTNVRANVWFHGLDARSRGRVMVSAELPLLYPLGRSKEIPEIKYPTAEEDAAPAPRERTGKLESEPYLATLAVYRYRPEHRHTRSRSR